MSIKPVLITLVIVSAGIAAAAYITLGPDIGGFPAAYVYMLVSGAGVFVPTLISRYAKMVFLFLATFYGFEGILRVYAYSPWGWAWDPEMRLFEFATTFSTWGMPLGFLCASIYIVWVTDTRSRWRLELTQYTTCILLYMLNWILTMLHPWNIISAFGTDALAIGFGCFNILRILRGEAR